MPIHVAFDASQPDLLVATFTKPWDWPEFHRAFRAGLELIKDVPNIYVINHVIERGDDLNAPLPHYITTINLLPPNVRLMVVVPDPEPRARQFVDLMLSAAIRLFDKGRTVIVKDYAEALRLVEEHRQRHDKAAPR